MFIVNSLDMLQIITCNDHTDISILKEKLKTTWDILASHIF